MTGAPLPPHERAWRHPSEVGRVEHEPPTARSHAIVVSTAAIGLLLVALLAVAVTPGGSPDELASSGAPASAAASDDVESFATVAPLPSAPPSNSAAVETGAAAVTADVADSANTAWTMISATPSQVVTTILAATTTLRPTTLLTTIEATVVITTAAPETSVAPAIESGEVAVPIDNGTMALMTQPERAVTPGEAVTAELPTGDTVTAMVMATDTSGLVVVSLPGDPAEPYQVASTALAALAPDDTIHVHGSEAVTMDALGDLDVVDGTPLTDAAGTLVGLCVEDPASGATTMMVIDRARVDAIGG